MVVWRSWVAGTSHAGHVAEHVPGWWGIIAVEIDEEGQADFYILREPRENPKVKDDRKITILWKQACDELFEREYHLSKTNSYVRPTGRRMK